MALTLKDVLRDHSARHSAQDEKNRTMIDEWRVAVEGLFAQLREWLKTSDPAGILRIEQAETEVHEPSLGRYRIPRLDLHSAGKWIGIIPKARKTIKTAPPPRKDVPERATGRVDITDELRRFVLYRFDTDGWTIEDTVTDQLQLLTQETFESALMGYFR